MHVSLGTSCVKEAISELPKPLFQSEAVCEAIIITMIFYSHANKTNFRKKGFTHQPRCS